jgi:hypothetical protein
LKSSGTSNNISADERYSTGKLIRRLFVLAWQFRADCIWSVILSLILLLLGIAGLKLPGDHNTATCCSATGFKGVGASVKSSEELTWTEKTVKAKGCKSLEELNDKFVADPND